MVYGHIGKIVYGNAGRFKAVEYILFFASHQIVSGTSQSGVEQSALLDSQATETHIGPNGIFAAFKQ